MKHITKHGYYISGNEFLAIAINVDNPADAHYFTPQTMEEDGIEQDAFTRAIGWAYPGPGCDEIELPCGSRSDISPQLRSDLIAYLFVLGSESYVRLAQNAAIHPATNNFRPEITGCLGRIEEALRENDDSGSTLLLTSILEREAANHQYEYGAPELIEANRNCADNCIKFLNDQQ